MSCSWTAKQIGSANKRPPAGTFLLTSRNRETALPIFFGRGPGSLPTCLTERKSKLPAPAPPVATCAAAGCELRLWYQNHVLVLDQPDFFDCHRPFTHQSERREVARSAGVHPRLHYDRVYPHGDIHVHKAERGSFQRVQDQLDRLGRVEGLDSSAIGDYSRFDLLAVPEHANLHTGPGGGVRGCFRPGVQPDLESGRDD